MKKIYKTVLLAMVSSAFMSMAVYTGEWKQEETSGNIQATAAIMLRAGNGQKEVTTAFQMMGFCIRTPLHQTVPLLQIILNLPFLAVGFLIKFLFFAVKGMGKEYAAGIKNGFSISMKNKKVPFRIKHLPNYCKIQLELWINIIRRFRA